MRPLLILLVVSACAYPQAQSPKAQTPTVSQQPTPITRATDNKEDAKKESNDERIVIYTEKLALYTSTLACFTGLLALIGILQFFALIWQATSLRHHSELIHNAIILTQRPRLIVRNVTVTNSGLVDFASDGHSLQGQTITGQFYVANVGGTRARITEVFSMFGRGPLQMERPYETRAGAAVDIPLVPGKSAPIPLPTVPGELFTPMGVGTVGQMGGDAYVTGWVEYVDDMGNSRRTAFCRRWNRETRRFHIVSDVDYEHAE